MRDASSQCADQARLLAGMASGSLDVSDVTSRLARLPAAWDEFEGALASFVDVVDERRGARLGRIGRHGAGAGGCGQRRRDDSRQQGRRLQITCER
jgi:hypothetical protein